MFFLFLWNMEMKSSLVTLHLILQTLDNPQLEHKTVVFLGSIEGIRKEIKNNKDREQFFVLTLFLGLLGLYIGILAVRKKRTNKAT